jgi:hypothetical protein
MDDWNSNPKGGLSWRLYVVIGILATIAMAVAIAYAVSRVAPPY